MLRFRIYQVNIESNNAFRNLEEVGKPKPSDYVLVYDGVFPAGADNNET